MESERLRRVLLKIHYDGSAFFGWQLQPRERTVQGELERVLSRLLNRPARVLGSGRTDRGVHALGQIATVDVPPRWEPESLRRALNKLLPDEIWVESSSVVPSRFHPRYDAVSRSYLYRIGIHENTASPFHKRWCWALRKPLDLSRMDEAAARLPGDHSFLAFAKSGQEERGDRCTVTEARWSLWGELGLEFHISANRFLHHMVRYIVGTLCDVGLGVRPGTDVAALLAGDPGLLTSPPAPPQGLFLSRVDYPPEATGETPPSSADHTADASHNH